MKRKQMLHADIVTLMIFASLIVLAIVPFLPTKMSNGNRRLFQADYQDRPPVFFDVESPLCPHLRPEIAFVYVAGCRGLKAVRDKGFETRTGKHCVFKVGALRGTCLQDCDRLLSRRMEALGRINYAACVMTATGHIRKEDGFVNWQPQRLKSPNRANADGVTLLPYAIAVTLPPDLSFRQFEAKLRCALEPISLHTLLGTRRGRTGCRYSLGHRAPVLQTELVSLRPRSCEHVGRLISVIAAIVTATRA